MSKTDRVEVVCVADLKGPGPRGRPCRLAIAAIARAGRLELTARLTDYYGWYPREIWLYSSRPASEQEAVDRVRAFAANPASFLGLGRATGEGQRAGKSPAEIFPSLKLEFLIDTTQGAADLAAPRITVGLGRHLAAEVERGAELTPALCEGITRWFTSAPFRFGYWAPYKRLIKLLEARPGAEALVALALARIDGQLDRVARVRADEILEAFVPEAPSVVAGPDTLAYLMRRGRRWLRRFGRKDPDAYVRCAAALLATADAQGAHPAIASRLILSDILYGRQVRSRSGNRGARSSPDGEHRQDRRWDRFPEAWNTHLDRVRELWVSARNNPDIQIWAFNVLREQREPLPPLRAAGLRLAMVGPSKRLRGLACASVAEKPARLLHLDAAAALIFIESSSHRQFAAVLPTLESNPDAVRLQDAVELYVQKHGLSAIRQGVKASTLDRRTTVLLLHALRFLPSRFQDEDTYRLACFVGETTRFKPAAHWTATFGMLPLKTLVELRLHLPGLPKAVARSIDAACRTAIARGNDDGKLVAALTLNPSQALRALGWSLLAHASEATVATAWNMLLAGPASPERLEALLLRLASAGDSPRTLEALEQLIAIQGETAHRRHTALLHRLIDVDPGISRAVWTSTLQAEQPSPLARIHLASRPLATALVDAVDADELRTVANAPADLLTEALRMAPSRLYREPGFAVACATCPQPALQQLAIARLVSRRLVGTVFVSLAESGMPAAVAAVEHHLASIRDRTELTKTVIVVCDSGVRATRELGLRLVEQHPERLDLGALLSALSEHTAPEVTATVARRAAAGTAIRRESLARFDNRVLRTRHTGRAAKELVKRRLQTPVQEGVVPIGNRQPAEEQRIQALIDMARGSSPRDRGWALQQLAGLALAGQAIPRVRVSATSTEDQP